MKAAARRDDKLVADFAPKRQGMYEAQVMQTQT
jgi:hypothetical protein